MDDPAIFAAVADERRMLADVIESLTPEQLATPSLCGQWTVHDLAGHLVVPLVLPTSRIVLAMLKAGGDFDRANAALAVAMARELGARVPTVLRERATSRFTPPGNGPLAPLTDALVHGQDLRRPLGIGRTFDEERLRAVLNFLVSPRATRGFTRKGVAKGVTLQATDLDWSHGSGPVVRGTGEALMMALTRRRVAFDDLTGDGLAAFSRGW